MRGGTGEAPPTGVPTTPNPVVRVAAGMAAVFAAVLLLFVGIGLALPGAWEVERSASVSAPPEAVYARVADLRRWDEWTPWPRIESVYEGPPSGVGAVRRWDDPAMGDGVFRIVEADAPRRLAYRVAVEDSTIHVRGAFELAREGEGTRVTWREEGDFGWNPLLAWMALAMDRIQGEELEKGLERLKAASEGRPPPAPDGGAGG